MRRLRTSAALAIGGAMLLTAGCAMGPSAPPIPPVVGPIAPAYMHADVIGGRAAGEKSKPPGQLLRPPRVRLRQPPEANCAGRPAGTGRVSARGPAAAAPAASGTFDVGGRIRRRRSTVNEIGLILKRFNQSLVDVLGHTDSTGTAASNVALSQRRAQSVAAQLRTRGVSPARVATRGYGAAHPIADNGTEIGRATNRRVEIKLVPLR